MGIPWLAQVAAPKSILDPTVCFRGLLFANPATSTACVTTPFSSDTNVMQLNVTLFAFLLFGAGDKLPIFLRALDVGRL